MSRSIDDRVRDVVDAIDQCRIYQGYLDHSDVAIRVMSEDALLHRLTEIGEAVRRLPTALVSRMGDGQSVRALRNLIVHEYFRIDRPLVVEVVRQRLPGFAVQVLGAAWTESSSHEASIDRWYSVASWGYMNWLEDVLGPRILAREIARWLTVLEDDLEEVVVTPWRLLYGPNQDPSEIRDLDSDYHYFNQAPMDLGWSDRYDTLWARYLILWEELNHD